MLSRVWVEMLARTPKLDPLLNVRTEQPCHLPKHLHISAQVCGDDQDTAEDSSSTSALARILSSCVYFFFLFGDYDSQ